MSRYLRVDPNIPQGSAGSVPEYYPVIRAAKYLNCKPWELEEAELKWFYRAQACEAAEHAATKPATVKER